MIPTLTQAKRRWPVSKRRLPARLRRSFRSVRWQTLDGYPALIGQTGKVVHFRILPGTAQVFGIFGHPNPAKP